MLRPENNITDPNIYHVPTANPIILVSFPLLNLLGYGIQVHLGFNVGK